MNPRPIEESIQRLLEGTISEEEGRCLQEELKRNPDVRKLYFSYVGLEQALKFRLERTQLAPDHKIRILQRTRQERRQKFIVMAAAACIALLVQLFVFRSILFSSRTTVAVKLSPYTLCQIAHPDGTETSPNTLVPGSRMSLEQGTVELTFSGGTRAVVQGPATFKLEKKDELRLENGTIWLLVSKEDHGFRVITPQLEAIDLGTDFGVMCGRSGGDEVHVFSGTVDVKNLADKTDKARLRGGEARKLAPQGKLASIPSRPALFSRSLPESLPMIQFDFTQRSDGYLNVTGDHPDVESIAARLTPPDHPPKLVPGRAGNAISFSGNGDYVATNWPGVAGNAPRTVSFWVKVSPSTTLVRNPAIVGWGDYKFPNGKWKVLLNQEKPGAPAYPRISLGQFAYDSPVAVNDGHWHHCAMTFTGRMLPNNHPDVSIHVDGENPGLSYRDYSEKGQPKGPSEPETRVGEGASPLTVGLMTEYFSNGFNGQIEDLRIYAGVLPEEAIRTQASQPAKH